MMSATDTQILDVFADLLPKIKPSDKERFLAYAEGMAFMVAKQAAESENKEESE